MVAGAVFWTGHFTITCIKVTAVTQGEAMGGVGTQKVSSLRLYQGNVGVLLGIHQPAVDGFKIIDHWIQWEVIGLVDGLQPLKITVTQERVPTKVKLWSRQV